MASPPSLADRIASRIAGRPTTWVAPELPKYTCCLCHKEETGYGNNPDPLVTSADARCCDGCNKVVVYLRIMVVRTGQRLNRANWLRAIRDDHPDIRAIKQQFS